MTEEQTNWDTRLVVKFIPANGDPEIIAPIEKFDPSMDLPKSVINSIDADNLGYSTENREFSFSFSVKAVNKKVLRRIYATAVNGTHFSVGVGVKTGSSSDWAFQHTEFADCVITNVNPSNVDDSGGVPTASFDAKCLKVAMSYGGQDVVTDNSGGAIGDFE